MSRSVSYEKYKKNVAIPLCALIEEGLIDDHKSFIIDQSQSLITLGWFDYSKPHLVEQDTTAVFKQYLIQSMPELLERAQYRALKFNKKIGRIRYNYTKVAYKLITSFERGGRFTNLFGLPYDGWAKQGTLLYIYWDEFYNALERQVKETLHDSDSTAWSLIALELRRRKLKHERTGDDKYMLQCPFQNQFKTAFEDFSLKRATELIKIPIDP